MFVLQNLQDISISHYTDHIISTHTHTCLLYLWFYCRFHIYFMGVIIL